MGGYNSHPHELDPFITTLKLRKTSDQTDGATNGQTVQHVRCGCLLLWSLDALLDQALCGPARLSRTAAGPRPRDDRSGTKETSGSLCDLCKKLDCLHAVPASSCVMQFDVFLIESKEITMQRAPQRPEMVWKLKIMCLIMRRALWMTYWRRCVKPRGAAVNSQTAV